MKRRNLIQMGLGGAWAASLAPFGSALEPVKRPGKAVLRPALAAYSFRDFFPYSRGKVNPKAPADKAMDMKGFISYCAKQGVAAELTSYFFPPDVTGAYLTECRDLAKAQGVSISGTAVGNQFTLDPATKEAEAEMTYVKQWIDHAVTMGAPPVRVFAGRVPKGMDEAAAVKNAITSLARAAQYAGEKGILLGIENHDSIGSAERLLEILGAVNSPALGINLDSGNFRTADPYGDFEKCVPYAVNVQLKETLSIGGAKTPADQEKFFALLRKGGYSGFVALEYEEAGNPFEAVPVILERVKKLCAAA